MSSGGRSARFAAEDLIPLPPAEAQASRGALKPDYVLSVSSTHTRAVHAPRPEATRPLAAPEGKTAHKKASLVFSGKLEVYLQSFPLVDRVCFVAKLSAIQATGSARDHPQFFDDLPQLVTELHLACSVLTCVFHLTAI